MRYSIPDFARKTLSAFGEKLSKDKTLEVSCVEPSDSAYDFIILGDNAHALATAYYLAKDYGYAKIAVLCENGFDFARPSPDLGIIRSDFSSIEKARLFEKALKMYETLSRQLESNVMFSPRGVLTLAHSKKDRREIKQRINALYLNAIEVDWLEKKALLARCPFLNANSPNYPLTGACLQKKAGLVHHNALCTAFARAASNLGVHLIENCPIRDIVIDNDAISSIKTEKGVINAKKVALSSDRQILDLGKKLALSLPLERMKTRYLLCEPVKPFLDTVLSSKSLPFSLLQTEEGEILLMPRERLEYSRS